MLGCPLPYDMRAGDLSEPRMEQPRIGYPAMEQRSVEKSLLEVE